VSWVVRWHEDALEELAGLARHDPKRAASTRRRVLDFARTGHGDVNKLAGRPNEWRLRVGSWRVTFTYDRAAGELVVLAVEPRGSAYRD
jgi:mRNA-degrading endonuclease RelE of RelBE toxin-antitoxin system